MVIWPLVPTPALLPCRGYARDTLEREEDVPGVYDLSGVPGYWLVVRRSRVVGLRARWTENPPDLFLVQKTMKGT